MNVDDMLQQIDEAVADYTVSPDAMRCNAPEPERPPTAGFSPLSALLGTYLEELDRYCLDDEWYEFEGDVLEWAPGHGPGEWPRGLRVGGVSRAADA